MRYTLRCTRPGGINYARNVQMGVMKDPRTATVIYLIGSLRNPKIPLLAKELRTYGYDVFDDWFAPGPEADDYWQEYETSRGRSYREALQGYAARHIFDFDKSHLLRADVGLLVVPAGKSCHLELGYLVGRGVPGYILFEKEPERWDVMYCFANDVFLDQGELIDTLTSKHPPC